VVCSPANFCVQKRTEQIGTEKADPDFTLWELAWLVEHNHINISGTLESFLRDATEKVVVKPITAEIAALAARLPSTFPKDPGDRLIASTAISQGMPLVTADERIRKSQVVSTVW